jgi:hypothetical protein
MEDDENISSNDTNKKNISEEVGLQLALESAEQSSLHRIMKSFRMK